jgi:hypothetical protein
MDRDQRLVHRQERGGVGGAGSGLPQRHDGQHADDADDDGDRFEQTHEDVAEGDALAVLPDDRVQRRGGTDDSEDEDHLEQGREEDPAVCAGTEDVVGAPHRRGAQRTRRDGGDLGNEEEDAGDDRCPSQCGHD